MTDSEFLLCSIDLTWEIKNSPLTWETKIACYCVLLMPDSEKDYTTICYKIAWTS